MGTSTSASVASRIFRPTWLANPSNACASCPRFHCTTNCAPLLSLASPTRSSTHISATSSNGRWLLPSPPPNPFSPADGSALGRAARALRRAERDHVSCLATTQALLFDTSEMDTASPSRGLRIRCIVPAGGAIRRGWWCVVRGGRRRRSAGVLGLAMS